MQVLHVPYFKDGNLKPRLPPSFPFFPHTGIHAKAVKYSEFPGLFPSPLNLNIHYPRISNGLIDLFPFTVSQKNQKAQSFSCSKCTKASSSTRDLGLSETFGFSSYPHREILDHTSLSQIQSHHRITSVKEQSRWL